MQCDRYPPREPQSRKHVGMEASRWGHIRGMWFSIVLRRLSWLKCQREEGDLERSGRTVARRFDTSNELLNGVSRFPLRTIHKCGDVCVEPVWVVAERVVVGASGRARHDIFIGLEVCNGRHFLCIL